MDPAESLRDRALRWLHRQPAGSELNLHRGLTSIFPDGPSPVGFSLDIIVADNESMFLSDFHPTSPNLASPGGDRRPGRPSRNS